jgi:MFS family permease
MVPIVDAGGRAAGTVARVRRLLVLVSAIVFVDTMLYAALTPLLPDYAEEFGLSKGGAGLLVAVYAVGVLAGAVPAGISAARLGPKRVALGGLVVVAVASVVFAFAGDVWTLGVARFLQGVGSALAWAGGLAWLISAAPRGRRGELLGTAFGAAIFGVLLGPVVGAVASFVGTEPTFTAVGALALGVAVAGLREPGAAGEEPSFAAVRRALADRRFLCGLWLMTLPALLFGVLVVLASLDLSGSGWGAAAIGTVFFATAAVEMVIAPLVGRLVDRRGALLPVRVALTAGIAVAVGLAWADDPFLIAGLALVASISWGTLFTPGMAILSTSAEEVGLPQALAFGLMNVAWASGAMVGPSLGGALGGAFGDPAAYGLGALACAGTLLVVTRLVPFGTRVARVPTSP